MIDEVFIYKLERCISDSDTFEEFKHCMTYVATPKEMRNVFGKASRKRHRIIVEVKKEDEYPYVLERLKYIKEDGYEIEFG